MIPVYTEEDYKEAEEHYATLSIPELRKYQEITQAQIPLAHDKGLTQTLEHLHRVDTLVAHAIYRKAFGKEGVDTE